MFSGSRALRPPGKAAVRSRILGARRRLGASQPPSKAAARAPRRLGRGWARSVAVWQGCGPVRRYGASVGLRPGRECAAARSRILRRPPAARHGPAAWQGWARPSQRVLLPPYSLANAIVHDVANAITWLVSRECLTRLKFRDCLAPQLHPGSARFVIRSYRIP